MKYILTTAILTVIAFSSTSCSCKLSGGAEADIVCDPKDTLAI